MNSTAPQRSHKFNPLGPAGYFITFRTYGTWLHGDQRGSIDRKGHNVPGTPMIQPDSALVRLETSRLKHLPVTLTAAQRKSVDSTIHEVCAHGKWVLHAANVRTQHTHIVISSLKSPELVMNSVKSWCTRRMRENGLWKNEYSPWSRHGSTRYLWNEMEIHDACVYVLERQGV
jgi:REP element-mobilizing transposase RayT